MRKLLFWSKYFRARRSLNSGSGNARLVSGHSEAMRSLGLIAAFQHSLACSVILAGVAIVALCIGCRTGKSPPLSEAHREWLKSWRQGNSAWRGVHLGVSSDEQAVALVAALPKLANAGANVVIVEINYAFDFASHPELRPARYLDRARARQLAETARAQGIRLIPQLNCLGHQSWGKTTGPLLAKYPQFDETPGQFPENTNIYCRSWCPQNPEINQVVFALIDELIDAFEADAFHVGMDEVFLIASEHCPRCHGGDPAKLFARAVNDLHQHIVKQRKCEMLMWSDRLLDADSLGYSKWEASKNGTQGAIDLVPKDIIMCDWHYGKQTDYPSVRRLLDKGFRVWPSGWQPLEATQAFSAFARRQTGARLLGYLCTTWGKVKIADAADWPPVKDVLPDWK